MVAGQDVAKMQTLRISHEDWSTGQVQAQKFSVLYLYTVFRRINVPGAEAQNEPLTLFDLNETGSVYSRAP